MQPTPQEALNFIIQLVRRPTTVINGFTEAQALSQALEILSKAVADGEVKTPPDAQPAS